MRIRLVSTGLAVALAFGVLVAAGGTATASTAPAGSAAAAKMRTFTCNGTLGRYYTEQTVTGALDAANTPRFVKVFNWEMVLQTRNGAPRLDPNYDGGYWTQTYGLNQWAIGRDAARSAAYHLMLPPVPGSSFDALLKTDFLPNYGNWQNWMTCTAS
jgi:hypothetical protein